VLAVLVRTAVEFDCVDEDVEADVELGFGAVVVVVVDLVCALSGAAITSATNDAMRIFMTVPPVGRAARFAATAVNMLSEP
jgi:hypothetical protein